MRREHAAALAFELVIAGVVIGGACAVTVLIIRALT